MGDAFFQKRFADAYKPHFIIEFSRVTLRMERDQIRIFPTGNVNERFADKGRVATPAFFFQYGDAAEFRDAVFDRAACFRPPSAICTFRRMKSSDSAENIVVTGLYQRM